jgi:type II secretory pathway pseudopilin PulG
MKIFNKQKNKGFTLIETMVAVFILTTTVVSLLSLTTSSLFASKYANNEITANYLLQEAVDYIRNDRDSVAFQQSTKTDGTGGWNSFLNNYGYNDGSDSNKCFSGYGCYLEAGAIGEERSINSCDSSVCSPFYYNPDPGFSSSKNFYTYIKPESNNNIIPSTFKRTIKMTTYDIGNTPGDELGITITVEWQNGNLLRSRSLTTSLLNWQ